ncbi:SRPBCC family protein [Nonomuraea sp. NPDC049784]|uniref:SRPBCC family protein n=1 Tax=Nonomuraea sp. NPDC049784 TaxID=3154361 RepID=UPI0033EF8F76
MQERITVSAAVAAVYTAVSDVRRMGEWSPECVGATLVNPDAEAVVGTRFTGHNRIGRSRTWTTRCTVTVADPPRCFAFDVSLGGRIASWRFDLIQSPDGTRTEVIQSWWDRRGPVRRRLSALISGIRDRASHNRETMRLTLLRLKQAMEST